MNTNHADEINPEVSANHTKTLYKLQTLTNIHVPGQKGMFLPKHEIINLFVCVSVYDLDLMKYKSNEVVLGLISYVTGTHPGFHFQMANA